MKVCTAMAYKFHNILELTIIKSTCRSGVPCKVIRVVELNRKQLTKWMKKVKSVAL